MVQTTPPDLMTADERLDEVARILAAGLLRLRAKARDRARTTDPQRIQGDIPTTTERVPSTSTARQSVHVVMAGEKRRYRSRRKG